MSAHRLVVVEDNIDIVEIVCTLAELSGIECSGVDSVAGLLDALDADPPAALLLLDLTLPGVSTSELLGLLAARHCMASVVLMSGAGRPGARTGAP